MVSAARLRLVPVVLLFACACSSSTSRTERGDIRIELIPTSASTANAPIRVTGLSTDELARLETQVATPEQWAAVLRVTVEGSTQPIVGRYVVANGAPEFHPAFPFDPGRAYAVTFDGTSLGGHRTAITHTVVSLPPLAQAAPVVVSAIHPSTGQWPENILRFYVHFSAPMSSTNGVGFIHVVGEDGEEIADALLPAQVDFWNDDHTRYTAFFDPGRVKRGILPNREMGRVFVAGRRYAIVVDAEWRDGRGRPLKERYRHDFVAGPAIENALDSARWRVRPPGAGTTDPLVVTFPTIMDHALLQRTMSVHRGGRQPIAGDVEIAPGENEWRFRPTSAWVAGAHQIVASAVLEDPAGNRINQAFEIDPARSPDVTEPRMTEHRTIEEDEYMIPFVVPDR